MTDDPTNDNADPDESPDDDTPAEGDDTPAEGDDTPAEGDDTPTEGGDEGDERPAIDDDERADVDLSEISKEIQEEEADDTPTEGGSESPDATKDADTQTEGGEEGAETPSEGGWGEMYVESLAVLLPEVAAEMRDDEDADAMSSEEVAALATEPPVELDQKFDAVVSDMGMEEMSDKQALLFSTAIVCGTVLLKDSDVAGDIVGSISEGVSA